MIIKNSEKVPVLWTTSRRSGSLFQGPLLAALNLEARALAVTSRVSPIRDAIANEGQLLADVSTPADVSSVVRLPFTCWGERAKLRGALSSRASIVHVTMTAPWDVFYLRAARSLQIPIVVTIHDAVRHPGDERDIVDWIERRTFSYADHFVTFSRFVHDDFKALGLTDAPIHLIEGGLLTRAEPQMEPRVRSRGRRARLLFLGRIHEYKGLGLLVEALFEIQQAGVDFQLTIAGAGDLSPYDDKLAQIVHVDRINRWIGDDELARMLADSDVMVMPYIEASQSGVAIDALWAALPTVATPVGALPQQFSDGVDAIIAETVSATAVAAALQRLLADDVLYAKLSQGAHESYQRIGLRPVAEMWKSFYREVSC